MKQDTKKLAQKLKKIAMKEQDPQISRQHMLDEVEMAEMLMASKERLSPVTIHKKVRRELSKILPNSILTMIEE